MLEELAGKTALVTGAGRCSVVKVICEVVGADREVV